MPQLVPYLMFNGNCAEAVRFYEKTLGGKIEVMMKNGDTPFADKCPKERLDYILHARLVLEGNGTVYAGDCPAHIPYEGIKGVSFMLNYDSVEKAKRIFEGLSEGGTITMPIGPTFWAKIAGMFIDKFGTSWGVNGELLPV